MLDWGWTLALTPNVKWAFDLSHMVCPKFNSHVYKLKKWAIEEHICLYCVIDVKRSASIEKCPMFIT
jgi:hypothetical protein